MPTRRDPSFASPLSQLAGQGITLPEVTTAPAPGQGLSLDVQGRIPTAVETPRLRTEHFANQNQQTITTASTSFVDMTRDEMQRIVAPDALSFYDAGFRPQITLRGFLVNSGVGTTVAQADILSISEDDTAFNSIGSGGTCSMGGTTGMWCISPWAEITVTPGTDTDWIILVQKRASSGTGTFSEMHLGFRWV